MKNRVWKKRLLSLLTVGLLIAGIVVYTNLTINSEVNEKTVIVTKVDIPPRTEITEEMLATHKVPSRAIPLNAITDVNSIDEIVGKWTVAGYGLSKNSYIFKDKIVNQKDLPDAGLLELKEGEVAVPLLVDLETSLGNSIIPDTHIDLYFRSVISENNEQKALSGTLASNVRVVAVKDSEASNVFDIEGNIDETTTHDITKPESTTMAKIYIFAVPVEIENLIDKAKLLGEVFPVATGKTYETGLEVISPENEVIEYIEKMSYKTETEEGE